MTFAKAHQPCPDCGSSDALAVNEDGSTKCFACGTYNPKAGAEATTPLTTKKTALQEPSGAFVGGFSDRKINRDTADKFNVLKDTSLVYFPYYNKAGERVAYKVRDEEKNFRFSGDSKHATLFGQNVFAEGGKYITITEGEFDALAAYQMMGSKWPAVSVRNGASGALKDCKDSFEYLDSFENVVICFDNDEPGNKAAAEVAELFGSKALIFRSEEGFKDSCDYLAAGQQARWVSQWWAAKAFKPEGIVTIADIKQRLLQPPEAGVPWAFDTLTTLTYGRRKGELYAFGAGVGVGKTDVFTQQIAYDIETLNKKVGVIYLEQNVVETAQRIAGKLDKRLYHIPDGAWTRDQYEASIDRLEWRNQVFLFEHFGSMEWSVVKKIIKYFNKAYDIEHIYLDHLTALSANAQDERRALDGIMADMAGLANELGIMIHFISHLTTPEGKPHEEGGRVMEKHFTGSRAIARWSHYMFGLERDKQAEDLARRQTTTFRVLKDRHTGRATGCKFGLMYNQLTGILNETQLLDEELL